MDEWRQIWQLFHNAWGNAKASTDYHKQTWLELQRKLEEQQLLITGTNEKP